MRLRARVQMMIGVARSLRTYYGSPSHLRRMKAFYAEITKPGDLVFDIGAHVGDRVWAFRSLGCKVVAMEPQTALVVVLRLIHGRSRNVAIVPAAISDTAGSIRLRVNSRNPTVSTASSSFVAAAQDGAVGWHGQTWDQTIEVHTKTLDLLIEAYGAPAFIKIDVEGFEDRALAGLSHAVPVISFEFTTHQRDVASRSLDRLAHLGDYNFNACLGESWTWVFPQPVDIATIRQWLVALPDEANSGDIYCFLC